MALRRIGAPLAALFLISCDAPDPEGPGAASARKEAQAEEFVPKRQARLAGGAVIIDAPTGYCIDPQSLRRTINRPFALLASCRILSEGTRGIEVPPALITVTVGKAGEIEDPPTAEALAAGADAPLVQARRRGGLVLALLGSGGEVVLDSGDPRHWRGATVLGDRLIGFALYAPQGSHLAGTAGAVLLQDLAARIVAASPRPDAKPEKAQTKPLRDGPLSRLFRKSAQN